MMSALSRTPDQRISRMNRQRFKTMMKPVIAAISRGGIDGDLEAHLNEAFPPSGRTFRAIEEACHEAIAAG